MKIFSPTRIAALLASALFLSCAQTKEDADVQGEPDPVRDSARAAATEKLLYSIPSPIETAMILKRAGATYDKDLLNDVLNKDKYVTLKGRALNLGVYGADLAYATIFDNSQESLLYLKAAKSLADDLGITEAFSSDRVAQMEQNLSNQDSLLALISSAYWETDSYLQENGRGNVSALIIAGGWIEGLYIGTKMERTLAKTGKNSEMKIRIADQKLTLENLISLLESFNNKQTFGDILTGLHDLRTVYNQISVTESSDSKVADPTVKNPTIGVTTTINVTDEQLQQIAAKAEAVRKKIITTT